VLPDLFKLADEPERLAWEFFRPGVEIHRLYGDGKQGPAAALLRYEPGAQVPPHTTRAMSTSLCSRGLSLTTMAPMQRQARLVINAPGSGHQVASETGCIVLIIWEKPVAMPVPRGAQSNALTTSTHISTRLISTQ
jgi:anti-sigma factor ChrR (cupin superfamily)